MDAVWTKDDDTTKALGDSAPRRVALTCAFVVTNDDDDVLLVDPHADGSWKQWMLPYSSLILDSDPITKKALSALDTESTLLDVQKALDALLADKRDEYQQALNDHINNVFPRGTLELGDAIGLNYSLKFSKTSDSYTGYRFEYRSARSIGATTEAPSLWISMSRLEEIAINRDTVVRGRTFASNVLELPDMVK